MENNHLFYLRQLCHLLNKGQTTEAALAKLIENIDDTDKPHWQKVQAQHQSGHGLFDSLKQLHDPQVDQRINQLRYGLELGIEEKELLAYDSDESINSLQIYSIIKSRLLKSIGYAAVVSTLALIVLGIFVIHVLPVYQEVLYDAVVQNYSVITNIEALTFQSWQSILIYLPPVLVIVIFFIILRLNVETILSNKLASYVPLIKGIKNQAAKINFCRKLNAFSHHLPQDKEIFLKQLNSPFFTGNSSIKINTLLDSKSQKKLSFLHEMETLSEETGAISTSVESTAIESISQKANALAIVFHIMVILIAAKVIQTLYIPIFQLGAGF